MTTSRIRHDFVITSEEVVVAGEKFFVPHGDEKMQELADALGSTSRNAYIGAALACDYMTGKTPRICATSERAYFFSSRVARMGFMPAALREALEFRWMTHAKMTRAAWRRARREIRMVFDSIDAVHISHEWDEGSDA